MNTTTVRAGLALFGTTAVLASGALASGAMASAQPAQAAAPAKAAAAATTTHGGHGHGHHKGNHGKGKHGDKAAQGRAAVTFLVECVDDNRVQKPSTFTLACADGNQSLQKLNWRNCGHTNAFATGVVRENVSEPLSKGDKWITYPVRVKATQLVDGEASATYRKLIVRTIGKAPKGVNALQIFDLPGNEPVKGGHGDGHEGQSNDPIVSDGHEDQSNDPIISDGHEDQSNDPIIGDGHEGQSNDGVVPEATFITECVQDNRVQKPVNFTLACGDGNQKLEKLSWSGWGFDTATAKGVVRENVSEPLSKGDRYITYPVQVTASKLVNGEATRTYNKLTVKVIGKAPAGVDRVQVFDLPGNDPAEANSMN